MLRHAPSALTFTPARRDQRVRPTGVDGTGFPPPPLYGGRTLSPIHTLSTATKAYEPDIAVARDGSFVVARHEEQFPFVKTVVQTVRVR
jgi:hypothetical protein